MSPWSTLREATWRKNPDTVGGAMLSGMRRPRTFSGCSRGMGVGVEDLEATLPAEEEEEGNG